MRWQGRRRSSNIEDRRGQSPARAAGAGGGLILLFRFLPFLLRSKTGRILLLLAVVVFVGAHLFGINLLALFSGQPQVADRSGDYQVSPEDQSLADFVAVVLADTEATWQAQFQAAGANYPEPVLVLFNGAVNSACGLGRSAMGPFYCPGDNKIYIDLAFYRDLKQRHQAPGDFAQAYVIAHEVGHHVQNVLGISDQVRAQQQGARASDVNALSVRLELQADCFAGIWAHNAKVHRQLLEEGDLEEALRAAAAIGDDRLQRQAQGHVVPESFTHGTSEQRQTWFRKGFDLGSVQACDTFAAGQL